MIDDMPSPSGSMTGISLITQVLGNRFEIIEVIGKGGMATVYRAVQKNLNRPVALKVIHQNLVHDNEFIARFHKEAQVCASLSHPNIITVYDEGEISGVHFMVLEYLEGTDLHHYIRSRGRLTPEQTMQYLLHVAEALEYAHGQKLIHRDVKSANIFLTGSGRVVLTDFGIAHAAMGTQLTKAGVVLGTPEYMSPEQADGKGVDFRSDLYSLGVVFYECMSGSLPFKGEEFVSTIYKVINEKPNMESLQHAPDPLILLIENLLEKAPEKRPGNAKEVINAILTIQQGKEWMPKSSFKSQQHEHDIHNIKPFWKPKKFKPAKTHSKISTIPQIVWYLAAVGMVLAGLLFYFHQRSSFIPEESLLDGISEINFREESGNIQSNSGEGPSHASDLATERINDQTDETNQTETNQITTADSRETQPQDITTNDLPRSADELNSIRSENEEWENAKKRNIISVYEEYLGNYPNGRFADDAKSRIAGLRLQQTVESRDKNAWEKAQSLNTIVSYRQYRRNYPNGQYSGQAATRIGKLETELRKIDIFYNEMIFVAGSTFTMGCTSQQENDCWDNEKPANQVTVGDFFIGRTPVTQRQWRTVMGNNPSHFTGNYDHPVERVSWNDVQDFLKRLNEKTGKIHGKNYRLPTEAEWEYAARGGRSSRGYKYPGSNDIEDVGWYNDNSRGTTRPVGNKRPNELGLLDMCGNVWEWCQDWFGSYTPGPKVNPAGPQSGTNKVARGGSWSSHARSSRTSSRGSYNPGARSNGNGFRLVLSE